MISPKKKLTLTVDSETVEKAKRLGINISELTEKVLRGFAFDPKDETRKAVRAHYRELFGAMSPALSEYGASVLVADYLEDTEAGEGPDIPVSITFEGGDRFWIEPYEATATFDELKDPLFLEPNEILQNFIDALERAKAKRRERLESLELARRIIEAMTKPPLARGNTSRNRKKAQGAKTQRPLARTVRSR